MESLPQWSPWLLALLVACGSPDDVTDLSATGGSAGWVGDGGALTGGRESGGSDAGGTGGAPQSGARCDEVPACASKEPCELEYTVDCAGVGYGWYICGEASGYVFQDGEVFGCPADGSCADVVQLAVEYCSALRSSGGTGGTGGGSGGTGGTGGGSGGTGGTGGGSGGTGGTGGGSGGSSSEPDACEPPVLRPYPAKDSGYDVSGVCGWTSETAPVGYAASGKVTTCGDLASAFRKSLTSAIWSPGWTLSVISENFVSVVDGSLTCGTSPTWGKQRVYRLHTQHCAKVETPFPISIQSRYVPLDDSNPAWSGATTHPAGVLLSKSPAAGPGAGTGCWVLGITEPIPATNETVPRLEIGVSMTDGDGWVHVSAAALEGNVCPLTCD